MGDSLTMTYESAGMALWTCRYCGEKNVTHLNEDWVCICGTNQFEDTVYLSRDARADAS